MSETAWPSVSAPPAAPPRLSKRPRRLTPARPGAVVVPPLAGGALAALAVATVEHAVGLGASGAGGFAKAAVLAALSLFAVYAVRTVLRGRCRPRLARWSLVPVGLTAALAGGAWLPGPALLPATLAASALLPVVVTEGIVRWRLRWLRTRQLRASLLAPSEMAAEEAIARLESLPGVEITSVVVPDCDVDVAIRMLERPVARTVAGRLRLAPHVIVSRPARDRVVDAMIAQLVALGHTITSESAVVQEAEGRIDIGRANPLTLLLGRPRSLVADALRRVLDVAVAVVLLALLSPLLLLTAALIVLDSRGGPLYSQGRVGRSGRMFPVLKFRTMRADAESGTGPVFATGDDPRVTRIGRVLRRYRIDELPQLVNVLLGSMTLIGPRPERPHFFNVLRKDVPLFELRACVKPGITGWAQVRLPYTADSDEARVKLEYDLYYVTRRSLLFDLAILLETVGVALSGAGSR